MKFQINKAPLNQCSNSISRDNNLACSGRLNNAVEHIKNRSVFRLNGLLAQEKKTGGKRNAEVAVSCPQHIFSSPLSSKTIMIIHLSTYRTPSLWKRQNRPQNLCLNGCHQKKYQFIWMHETSRNQCNQKEGLLLCHPVPATARAAFVFYYFILQIPPLPLSAFSSKPRDFSSDQEASPLLSPCSQSCSFSWDSKKFLYCQH